MVSNTSKVFVIASNPEYHNRKLTWGDGAEVDVLVGDKAERLLGNWFSGNNLGKASHQIINQKLNELITRLLPRRITGTTMIYIVNNVLYPRIAYICKTLDVSTSQLNTYYTKVKGMVKHALKLPSSTPDSVLEHPTLVGLNNWNKRLTNDKATDLFAMLNDNMTLGQIARIRLIHLQDALALPYCPLSAPLWYKPKHVAGTHYLEGVMNRLTDQLIRLHPIAHLNNNGTEEQPIGTIQGGSTALLDAVGDSETYDKARAHLAKWNIRFLEQLMCPESRKVLTKEDIERRFGRDEDKWNWIKPILKTLNRKTQEGEREIDTLPKTTPNPFAPATIQLERITTRIGDIIEVKGTQTRGRVIKMKKTDGEDTARSHTHNPSWTT